MPILIFSDLFNKIAAFALKQKWDYNWPQATILYNARGAGNMDIRQVFQNTAEGDAVLQKIADNFKAVYSKIDERAYRIAQYVNKIMTYEFDKDNYGKVEFWASPYEVWEKKHDDCDGFATLIKDLLDKAEVPSWRSKIAAGDVEGGGHAYVLYLKEFDNEWYTLEGSYYASEAFDRFDKMIPHRNAKRYSRIWWTTNKETSWAQHDLIIKEGINE